MKFNIVLANNCPHSHTRISLEYAREMISRGHSVIISYPVVSFFDFLKFELNRDLEQQKSKFQIMMTLMKFSLRVFYLVFNPYNHSFRGRSMTQVDKNIVFNKYVFSPTVFNMPDADIVFVYQDYILPKLVGMPKEKGIVVGSIHIDYLIIDQGRSAIESFLNQMVLIDKQINVPRYAVSKTAESAAVKSGVRVDKTIQNGIELSLCDKVKNITNNSKIIITLFCSLRKEKGLKDGVSVINELRNKNLKNVEFHSIGDVDQESALSFDVNHGYLSGDSYFEALCKTDIFVYSSLQDGFPAPPLEAAACGCSLVTTLVPGVDEWAIDGVNSLTVSPGDVSGMVKGVERLLNDKNLMNGLSNAGVKVADRYSWSKQTDKLLDYVEELVKDKV